MEQVKQSHDFMEPIRRETLRRPTEARIPALGHKFNPRACADLKAGEVNHPSRCTKRRSDAGYFAARRAVTLRHYVLVKNNTLTENDMSQNKSIAIRNYESHIQFINAGTFIR